MNVNSFWILETIVLTEKWMNNCIAEHDLKDFQICYHSYQPWFEKCKADYSLDVGRWGKISDIEVCIITFKANRHWKLIR